MIGYGPAIYVNHVRTPARALSPVLGAPGISVSPHNIIGVGDKHCRLTFFK